MSDLLRKPQRFEYLGLDLSSPVDSPTLRARGKYPVASNIRAYGISPIETRPGLTSRFTTASAPVHSIQRLSDPLAATNPLVVGASTKLYAGTSSPLTEIDTGYSANPLAFVQYQPEQSPSPWLYIGDSSKMRKTDSSGTDRTIGIAPPTYEPTAALGTMPTKDVDTFQATTNWSADNTILDNAGITLITRINTTVTASIGDVAGGGAGWYTIYAASMANIFPGTFVTFGTTGGSSKFVQAVRAPSFTTTVAAITYDSGATGLCSIQPTAAVYLDVDSMVYLNSSEYVHVQSVTYAPDGTVQSFRCTTVGTIAATQAIAGVGSFRAYCDAAPTGTITRSAVQVAFKTVAAGGVGYITKTAGLANSDLSQISNRQIGPDDEMGCAFKMNNLNELVEMKLYANVDASDTSGTQNSYVWTVRPADVQKIINDELTVIQAQNTQLTNDAIGTVVGDTSGNTGSTSDVPDYTYGGTGKIPPDVGSQDAQPYVGMLSRSDATDDATGTPIGGGGAGGTGSVPQGTISTIGNAQWIQLRLKLSDAVRVGAAAERTLQTVTAIRISVNVTAVVNTDTIAFDAWWIGGTYGPDVGDVGQPYVYRIRGRDSRTGAMSNPGPSMRLGGGIFPRRQSVTVSFNSLTTAVDDSWAQCNRVDIERWGGSLTDWRWLGSVVNDPTSNTTLSFTDSYPDDWMSTRPILPTNLGQPFLIIDTPLTGTCNVSGTTVTRVSGDVFPLTLDIGNTLQIGVGVSAVNYVTHNRPITTSKVEIETSGGSQSAVTWTIYAPKLIGQPLPCLWGPLDNFMFGAGDITNPGRLYWLNGNNPDGQDQTNYIDVTPPSEQLQNGCMWDGKSFVWSTDRMFAIYPTFEGAIAVGNQILGGNTQLLSPFRAIAIPNSQGLYTRWGFCVGPKIWQLGRDGIYETSGGEPESITDQDLYQWFPHDGQPGKTVNGYAPPDLTYTHASTRAKDFRLSWGADILYFDYRATDGTLHTIPFDTVRKAWLSVDSYGRATITHYYDQGTKDADTTYVGAASYHLYLGGTDGSGNGCVFENVGTDDDGVAISCQLRTPSWDADEPWMDKQWEDSVLDCDRGAQTLTVTPGVNNYLTTVAPTTISTGAGRQQYVIDGANTLGRNYALNIAWSGSGPALYLWEPSFLPHSYLHTSLATVTLANRKAQYQFVRDGWLAYYSDGTCTLTIIVDGTSYTYNLPSSGGLTTYVKNYIVFQPIKGKGFQFKVTLNTATGVRFINSDCVIRVRGWSEQGPLTMTPLPFAQAQERA